MRRAARAILVCLIATATLFEVNVATDPNVTSAPAAVTAIDRAHGSTPEMIAAASDRIAQALVASEDDTFYSNNGLDDVALLRAFWGVVTRQDLAPSQLDPFRNLAAAQARVTYVLQRLVSDGRLTESQATQLERSPLGLVRASSAAP